MFERLTAYLDSIKARDPAPRSRWEVLLYPGVLAMGMHRVAHWLKPFLPTAADRIEAALAGSEVGVLRNLFPRAK